MLRSRKEPAFCLVKEDDEYSESLAATALASLDHSDENKNEKRKRKRKKITDSNPPKRPAWNDDDDDSDNDGVAKNKKMFEKLTGTPKWAQLDRAQDLDSESDVEGESSTVTSYLESSPSLAKGILHLKRCPDGNSASPSKGRLHSVRFHPTSEILMTGGTDQTLKFFQVDGKVNAKIHSIFLEEFPILSAEFSAGGTEVVMGSRHRSFYVYDMLADKASFIPKIKGLEEKNMAKVRVSPDGKFFVFLGKQGNIHLLSAKSKEWVHSLHMNGTVTDVTFTRDGTTMYATGGDGKIYVFDLNTRQCTHSFFEDGGLHGTSIALSYNSKYLACGSDTGGINIYDKDACLSSENPHPVKAILKLTTSCTWAQFNPSSEILAFSSNLTEKAIKLAHIPSMTVFSNFPEFNDTKIRIPWTVDFSPNNGYFVIGSKQALLYRVKHYSSY